MANSSEQKKREEMIQLLKERAGSYVPEWRFDEENPDIGTALATVYGDMMQSVMSRYARMMEKKRIDFLNAIGAKLAPPISAKGFVTFGLVNDSVPETKVPAGTFVTADSAESETGVISYETQDDILVSPASISCIYEVNNKEDYIGKYGCDGEELDISLFQKKALNQQGHELYIGHCELFQVTSAIWVSAAFFSHRGVAVKEELLKQLVNPEAAEITYSTQEGYVPFESQVLQQGKLLLYKGEEKPVWTKTIVNGEESCWIRIRMLDGKQLQNFSFEQVCISVKTKDTAPDLVLADGVEADLHKYFPFGERLSIFNEVYFVSNEILCKRGGEIVLAFFLSFVSIPLDTNPEEVQLKWNWVMDERDFQVQKEYDITIARVIWEYYNGTGWTRLFPDNTYETIFTPENGQNGHPVKMHFTCPMDIKPAFVNSAQAYSIRARLVTLNNAYKLNGNYIAPVLEHTTLYCDYSSHPVDRVSLHCKNNMQFKRLQSGGAMPFVQMECEDISLYLGFLKPPKGGPIKMYLKFQEAVNCVDANLVWQYWNGKGFQMLRVVDETMNFSKTGLVTFLGAQDFQLENFFGEDRYWIRIQDASRFYAQGNLKNKVPFLKSITMNTVKIVNREMEQTEYFQMEYYVKKKKLRLQKKDIQTVRVFVKEQVIGEAKTEWKEWIRVEDFLDSGEQDRHFLVVPEEGYLQFGDGTAGRIPPVARVENIKVVYQCGGGLRSNAGEHEVNKLIHSIGFINSVRNVDPLSGGLDIEDRKDALKRNSSQIRVQNRAITTRDYENLAYEASRRIHKARCFSGMDGEADVMHGAVTLVLLLKDYQSGNAQFQGVRNTVEEYLKGKMPDTIYYAGKLFLIEPVFIIFQVKVLLRVSDFNKVFQVQKQVEEAVQKFFDPVTGNFDHTGWEVGYLPNQMQIRNIIHMVPDVDEVKSLFVTAFRHGGTGLEEIELEDAGKCPYVLPVSGGQEVTVEY